MLFVIIASLLVSVAQPTVPQELSPSVGRELTTTFQSMNAHDYASAEASLTALLGGDLTPYERATVLEVRAAVRTQRPVPDLRGAVADYEAALATGALSGERADTLRANIAGLNLLLGRGDGVAELPPNQRTRAYYEAGALDLASEAADALTDETERAFYRYLNAVRRAGATEAGARLDELGARLGPYQARAAAVADERAALTLLFADTPTEEARMARASAFRANYLYAAAAERPIPGLSAAPRPPNRCFERQTKNVTVEVEFDVTEKGQTKNVRVLSSDDRCFDRSVVAAVKSWRYAPMLRDGVPFYRRGVRTNMRFEKGVGWAD